MFWWWKNCRKHTSESKLNAVLVFDDQFTCAHHVDMSLYFVQHFLHLVSFNFRCTIDTIIRILCSRATAFHVLMRSCKFNNSTNFHFTKSFCIIESTAISCNGNGNANLWNYVYARIARATDLHFFFLMSGSCIPSRSFIEYCEL